MKKLELVTVHFEHFFDNFIFNLNCTMGENIINNKRNNAIYLLTFLEPGQ